MDQCRAPVKMPCSWGISWILQFVTVLKICYHVSISKLFCDSVYHLECCLASKSRFRAVMSSETFRLLGKDHLKRSDNQEDMIRLNCLNYPVNVDPSGAVFIYPILISDTQSSVEEGPDIVLFNVF